MSDELSATTFQLADALCMTLYRATMTLHHAGYPELVTQLRGASLSAVSNIVKGSSRASREGHLYCLYTAASALREVGYLLSLGERLGFLAEEVYNSIQRLITETSGSLEALIKALEASPQI